MGPRPQCYIPRPKVIGPLVPEKIFEGVLPYIGMAAILVMWPRLPEQTFIPPTSHEIWLWLAKWFWRSLKMVDGWRSMAISNWTDDRAWLYFQYLSEWNISISFIMRKPVLCHMLMKEQISRCVVWSAPLVVRCLDSIIPILAKYTISRL